MKLFDNKNNNVVGVDLGAPSIKLVELNNEGNQPTLITYGVINKQNEGLFDDSKQKTIANLKELMTESRITTENAIGALPASSVFSTMVTLPDMPQKEIDSAIQWEAKKLIPMPLEKMSLNWHVLKNGGEALQKR